MNSELPPLVTPDTFSGALPVLYTSTTWLPLVVPRFWLPKFKVLGIRVTTGNGVTPVPDSEMTRGLPVALSVTVTDPVRIPVAVGLNEMYIGQLLAWYTVVLVQLLLTRKSPAGVT